MAITILTTNVDFLSYAITAVSYTHLDVYKRQSIYRDILSEHTIFTTWITIIQTS